jgi:hypothetical protein
MFESKAAVIRTNKKALKALKAVLPGGQQGVVKRL